MNKKNKSNLMFEDYIKTKQSKSKGELLADLIAEYINEDGGIGPFGGEDVPVDGNKIELYAQTPTEVYEFNDDGSVDWININRCLEFDPEFYLGTTEDSPYFEEAQQQFIDEFSHYDSIKQLLNGDLSWFCSLDSEKILPIVDAILYPEEDLELLESKQSTLEPNKDVNEDIEKHDTLNPLLFDDEELKPEIKEKIEEIVDTFIEELSEDEISFSLKDIVLLGSNVSYNYTKDSDLDVHIIADSSNLQCPDNLYPLLYSAYRSMFNKNYDITIKGIPVELYVEMDEPLAKSNGIYSLNQGWLKKPVQQDIPDLDRDEFEKQFKVWEDRYFDLIGENEVLTEESKLYEEKSDDIKDFIEDLYDLRKESIAKDGEYGLGNLIFKEFRNLGYLDNLKELRKQEKGKELSLECKENR